MNGITEWTFLCITFEVMMVLVHNYGRAENGQRL